MLTITRVAIVIPRVPLKVHRVSITIPRTPITVARVSIIDQEQRRKDRSKRMMEKIKQIHDKTVLTPAEQRTMEVVRYYEYKCRVAMGVSCWRAVGQNFRDHRNWVHFTRIAALCQDNHWDYRVYLDSQFERVRYWKRQQKYPYPYQCYSENAVRYYQSYYKDYQECNSVTGDAKVKTSKPLPYQDEVIETVIKDCEHFVDFFKVAPRQRRYKGMTPEQMKLIYVTDHVASLSQYYWASLPWAVDFLKRFTTPWVVELTESVAQLQKSKTMMKTINLVVPEVENQLNIPHTVLTAFE